MDELLMILQALFEDTTLPTYEPGQRDQIPLISGEREQDSQLIQLQNQIAQQCVSLFFGPNGDRKQEQIDYLESILAVKVIQTGQGSGYLVTPKGFILFRQEG